MLQLITDMNEIDECEVRFSSTLMQLLNSKEILTIASQGGRFDNEISSRGGFWYSYQELDDVPIPRYWNGFGTVLMAVNEITVEINIPYEGIERNVNGLFAKDPHTKTIFLLHRGKVRGVGKQVFLRKYSGAWAEVDEGDGRTCKAILVTALDSPDILDNLTYFVHAVEDLKKISKINPELLKADLEIEGVIGSSTYTSEFSGTKKGKQPSSYVAECSHGKVVDALRDRLLSLRAGKDVEYVNNQPIDLCEKRSGKPVRFFEAKTKNDTQSIYTAVGQLMIHTALKQDIGKTIVIPQLPLDDDRRTRLQKLSIDIIEYEIKDGKVLFINI